MGDIVKQILAKPIQLADQVTKAAEEASSSFKQECLELKSKTEKLAGLLWQVARVSSDLYEWPTRRIIADTELLVGHLAFETVEEHSKYTIVSTKPTSIHALVIASTNNVKMEDPFLDNQNKARMPHPLGERPRNLHRVITSTIAMHAATKHGNESNPKTNGVGNDAKQGNQDQNQNHQPNYSHSGINMKGRDHEDPKTKANMKEMAARALWQLAKGNSPICRSITESRALLCFAVLLEKGTEAVQYNSAMAVMEITAVAEKDAELRKSAFKPNSPACKAVVDQVVKIIEKADSELLIPCIKTIGNLARTFKATETRMIGPLVKLLDEREAEVSREASIALTKFACTENYLHVDHSKAIIIAGGAKHLIQLVYFGGEEMVQIPALVLLSYIAMHVPDSEELAQAEVLGVIEWASKQSSIANDQAIEALLLESKTKLDLYQSRGPRGFHKLHLHHVLHLLPLPVTLYSTKVELHAQQTLFEFSNTHYHQQVQLATKFGQPFPFGAGTSHISNTGFALQPGESNVAGKFTCVTSDCGSSTWNAPVAMVLLLRSRLWL
ncbi:hypothetical protein glysoja_003152 [Glycine soja]|nr:hypothetical protein glysoja_003152 [Glycine soja]